MISYNGCIFISCSSFCDLFVVHPSRVVHEKELKNQMNDVRELQHQKESILHEVAELKVQLKIMEESRDTFRHELMDANRRLREGMNRKHRLPL